MADLFANFAYCTTTAAITSNTQTTVTVDETSRLPTNAQLAAADFYMTFESTLAANTFEVVKVTSKTTTSGAGTLTIVRGQDGTTAQSSIASGTVMKAGLTAGMVSRLLNGSSYALNRPLGTQQRQYTFDSSTQSWVATTGSLSNVSGKLRHTYASAADGVNVSIEPSSAGSVADGELWADVYPVTNGTDGWDDFGLIFRVTDSSNFYYLLVRAASSTSGTTTASMVILGKKVAGSYSTIKSTTTSGATTSAGAPLALGPQAGPYRLMIRFVGNVIHVYVNETFVLAAKDTAFSTGRVGLIVECFDNAGTPVVDFDNVTVLSLPSTWTPALYTPVAAAGDSAWTAPTLLNSWVTPWSTGYGTVGYRKDAMGFVHIRGSIKNGTTGANVFVLPAGYRPAAHILALVMGSSAPGVGYVDIDSSGNVFLTNSGNSLVSLDGIPPFFAEN